MTAAGEAPRPEFADELLLRLERGREPAPVSPVARRLLAVAAVTASLALILAGRKRAR